MSDSMTDISASARLDPDNTLAGRVSRLSEMNARAEKLIKRVGAMETASANLERLARAVSDEWSKFGPSSAAIEVWEMVLESGINTTKHRATAELQDILKILPE